MSACMVACADMLEGDMHADIQASLHPSHTTPDRSVLECTVTTCMVAGTAGSGSAMHAGMHMSAPPSYHMLLRG